MEIIKVADFEKEIIKEFYDEEKLITFLKDRPKKLDMDFSFLKVKELIKEDMHTLDESLLIDYLEDMASIEVENEDIDEMEKYLPYIASLAFNYLREGVFYLDIAQEGVVGFIKAQENFENIKNSDIKFEDYKDFWVIREIVIFINNKILNVQNEFMSYFEQKKHELEHGQIINTKDISDEVYLTEEDLLPNLEAIDKKENLVKNNLVFEKLKNRLSLEEIEILNLYYGFHNKKRYSIYEIEEKLNDKNDKVEDLFKEALYTLCTVEGKMFI